ncbi:hypothetical protein LTR85_009049 [Meristemomyces frigidus]|nr:hypothetical protein LTR85_009049 [Meristemomyces frigidus]
MDRISALPRELREKIHGYLIPLTLAARLNSVYVTPNKSVRAISSENGSSFSSTIALAATSKAVHKDVLDTIARVVCLHFDLSQDVDLTDRVAKGWWIREVPPTLLARLSKLRFFDTHLMSYTGYSADAPPPDMMFLIHISTGFAIKGRDTAVEYYGGSPLCYDHVYIGATEGDKAIVGAVDTAITDVLLLLERRLEPCLEQLRAKGHLTLNLLRKIQREYFFEQQVFGDPNGEWEVQLHEQKADEKLGQPIDPDNNFIRARIYQVGNGMQTNPLFLVWLRGRFPVQAYNLVNYVKGCPRFTYYVNPVEDGFASFECRINSAKHAQKILNDVAQSFSNIYFRYLTQPPMQTMGRVTYKVWQPRTSPMSRFERFATGFKWYDMRTHVLVDKEWVFELKAPEATLGNMLRAAKHEVLSDPWVWNGVDKKGPRTEKKKSAARQWLSKLRRE